MPAWDGLISRERAARPPRRPARASGTRPGGGSCLVERRRREHPRAHLPWRFDGGGHRQPRGGFPQSPYLVGARCALGQVLPERGTLGARQGVEGVAARQQVHLMTLGAHQVTSMQSRILIRPSRMRVLTVPSATPSSSATWG